MWKLKKCPRCGGDMFSGRNLDSYYEQCLQCSYQHELRDIPGFQKQPIQKEKGPVQVGRKPRKK